MYNVGMITQPRIEYAYSHHHPPDVTSDGLVIKLGCPGLSSYRWVLKLYCLVLGSIGIILSSSWVFFHLYVLNQTTLDQLKEHR